VLPLFDAAPNPLLADSAPPVVDPLVIETPVLRRAIPSRRLIEDQRRVASAAEAIAQLERDGTELVGLSRGQFSLADLQVAVIDRTGPAALSISTWTAARA
jgi:hypothetical protein